MEVADMNWRKSTYSGGANGSCVEVGSWRKSSHSGGVSNSCVEVADSPRAVMVRDTTDRDGGTLAFTTGAWGAFTASLR